MPEKPPLTVWLIKYTMANTCWRSHILLAQRLLANKSFPYQAAGWFDKMAEP
jgi:hypothetical protein